MLDQWFPEDSFGSPIACLATSFTFDADFFSEDCLSRFLAISSSDPEGAAGLDLAGMLEEEERLAESSVCVLVDQSCAPQHRNLRWDILPVRVPNALLHAKVAILLWERGARAIIGSANLTRAGYRSQVEMGIALDLGEQCTVPKSVFEDLSSELRELLALAPGDDSRPGPKARANHILDLFDDRVRAVNPPDRAPTGMKMVLAAAKRNTNPLDKLGDVWSGADPQSVIAVSPFWDDSDAMPGAAAVVDRLSRRSTGDVPPTATFAVPVEVRASSTVVRAPSRLLTVVGSPRHGEVVAFKSVDDRRLHAKCVLYRSSSWSALMFGSSNITGKGLGIDSAPHREINLWIGCRSDHAVSTSFQDLIPIGEPVLPTEEWEVDHEEDEDETSLLPLPIGFGEALLTSRTTLELSYTPATLPRSWRVTYTRPGSSAVALTDSDAWLRLGKPGSQSVDLPPDTDALPSVLDVEWDTLDGSRRAAWLVNLGDGTFLPPPAELRDLPAALLIEILASTRPTRTAFELAKRRAAHTAVPADELDPLRRFDSSGFLLQRVRRASSALSGIERRLAQRIHSLEALEWRLAGALGPEHLAVKLTETAHSGDTLPGEAQFLLAELVLTVHRVRWHDLHGPVPLDNVLARVKASIGVIRDHLHSLRHLTTDPAVHMYVDAVMREVAP